MRRKEEEREKEIKRIEEMKICDERPAIDAVELFCMNNVSVHYTQYTSYVFI